MRKWGLGCCVALVLTAVGLPAPAQAALNTPITPNPARPFTVYAHRGGAGLAPENTMGAFRQAQTLWGARGVWLEMDTQLTADRELVVMHDDSVDRTTTCTGTVISHTLASLAGCDASKSFPGWSGGFESIPTMRQVLTEGKAAGWRIMVEIKDIPLEANFDGGGKKVANVLIPLIREIGFPSDRILIQSFWPFALDQVKKLAPDIGTVFLTSSSLPGGPAGVGILATLNFVFSFLRGYTVSSPAMDTIDLSLTTVAVAHLLGRKVVPYTPDTPLDISRAFRIGTDGVITNRPDVAYTVHP
ncbi:MAG TPA: glycerophosphodiester phosphodiesterase [Acidimicrobiales bacterium]|nr:glycerophosphodiester phosphodiesterase [Acidimicrobiales bacterium]